LDGSEGDKGGEGVGEVLVVLCTATVEVARAAGLFLAAGGLGWRLDYNLDPPRSAYGSLTPNAVRLNDAARQLPNPASFTARPLSPAHNTRYQSRGSHKGSTQGMSKDKAVR